MTSAQQKQLHTIDEAVLTDIVRHAVRNDRVVVTTWHARELYGAGSGSRIYKVAGEAHDHGRVIPWSFVLKIFDVEGHGGIQVASADPGAWDYWKREWQVYQAPWLQNGRASVIGPRCLGAAEHPGVAAWVAMEDLSHMAEQPWSLARFHTVARHVGAFNGAYLAGRPIPADPWLSRGWLRGWTERAEPMVALLPTVADHPMVQQVFSAAMVAALMDLWKDRNAFLDVLDRLPQTLCHRDIFPRNVFVRQTVHGDQSVAIDWAFAGQGAVGEELAVLVGASLAFFEADPADAEELEEQCLSGYLAGLRSAGWHGDVVDVRIGYLAAYLLRYAIGALTPILTIVLNDSQHHWAEQIMGRPIDVIIRNMRATVEFQQQRMAEAYSLLASHQAIR